MKQQNQEMFFRSTTQHDETELDLCQVRKIDGDATRIKTSSFYVQITLLPKGGSGAGSDLEPVLCNTTVKELALVQETLSWRRILYVSGLGSYFIQRPAKTSYCRMF